MPLERGENSSSNSTIADQLRSSLDKKIEDNTKNIEHAPRDLVIKRVPNMLREENEKAYTPSVVSIGPLHSGNEYLQAMEADKLRYMCFLFERTQNPEETRKECEAAMLNMQNTLKKCYPDHFKENAENVTITNLLGMILIDGCFIMELVYRHHKKEQDNPILHNPLRYSAVQRDLLLLENQIPFKVLEELFRLTVTRLPATATTSEGIPPGVSGSVRSSFRIRTFSRTPNTTPTPAPVPNASLIEYLLGFFGDIMGLGDTGDITIKNEEAPLHILHLIYICYQPPVSVKDPRGGGGGGEGEEQPVGYQGATATQLRITGIKLRKSNNKRGFNLFDVKFLNHDSYVFFWRGRLEIPRFSIHNFTESFLRNLIAFEQCNPWIKISYFTSHAFLMDILMDSVEDVQILENAGVICNHLGTSESVLKIFNGICRNAAVPRHFYYGDLLYQMKRFRKTWRKELGTLKRNCAGNLWIVLSVIAAFVLFVLTLLQTIYTICSYEKS
ncbi:UPF0481 protein At3g47200-like [Cornus florida]|uniref:UPF0481 protein At3g47200-like n=1 Tax=Cornus florida TaxID=4283 RepID=UPI00289C2093|nr:UPF0481 protein At3g47200-like [Cornus florida]